MDTTTQMAVERTRLAADRTLMAWIRTAFSMIGFGFSVFKFFQYLRLFEYMREGAGPPAAAAYSPRNFGLLLIVTGTLALVVAIWQHRTSLKRLAKLDGTQPGLSLSEIVAVLVIVLGMFAFANVALRTGPL
jgi:putative membrane protein